MKVEIDDTLANKPLESQKAEVTPPVEVKKEEPKYVRLEDLEKVNQAINNTRDYNNRKLDEINQKLERLIPKPVEPKPDDLDELVQKDWKMGVRKVVESVMTEQTAKTQAESQEQFESRIRQESIKKVMERHKELNDPTSDKAKEFQKVLEENPDFVTNPRGPLLTAYEMENRLNSRATIDSRETKVNQVSKEARSRAAGVTSGTSPSGKSNYSLSKQDMDFCKLNNINPENYKRFKGMREAQV